MWAQYHDVIVESCSNLLTQVVYERWIKLHQWLRKALVLAITGLSMHRPPPIPPRQTRPFQVASGPKPTAGALFAPGQWPTPELYSHPIGRYSICQGTQQPFTSKTIQSALDRLGASSTLYLPPSSVWSIDNPILLHEHQELATWGYPTDQNEMAHLEAGPDCYPHIINARAKSGARLRNVLVDGGRERYGHEPKCGVMLQ